MNSSRMRIKLQSSSASSAMKQVLQGGSKSVVGCTEVDIKSPAHAKV